MENTEIGTNNPVPVIPFDEHAIGIPLADLEFCLHLAKMELGHSENMRHAAAHVREFLSEGRLEFTLGDWIDRYNIPRSTFNDIARSLRRKNMVTVKYGNEIKYRFTAKFLAPPMEEPAIRECPYPTLEANSFWIRLTQFRNSSSVVVRQVPAIVKSMMEEGKREFTAREWASKTGMSVNEFSICMEKMKAQQLVVNLALYDRSVSIHSPRHRFTLREGPFIPAASGTAEHDNPDFWRLVYGMCNSPSGVKHRTCGIIQTLLKNGKASFTISEMRALTGYSKIEFHPAIERMLNNDLISIINAEMNDGSNRAPCARYRLTAPRNTLTMTMVNGIAERLNAVASVPESRILSADEFWLRVGQMESSKAIAVRSAGGIVRSMIADGITTFTRQSWLAYSGMGKGVYAICRTTLGNKGLVYNLTAETRYDAKATGRYAFTLEGLDYSDSAGLSTNEEITAAHAKIRMGRNTDPEAFRAPLEKIAHFAPFENLADKIVSLMKSFPSPFTESQWAEAAGLTDAAAESECGMLFQMGLVKRNERGGFHTYSFRFETVDDLDNLIKTNEIHEPRGTGEFWNQLAALEWSKSNLMRRTAAIIREMVLEETRSFSGYEWCKRTGMSYSQLGSIRRSLGSRGIIIEMGDKYHRRYWIASTP